MRIDHPRVPSIRICSCSALCPDHQPSALGLNLDQDSLCNTRLPGHRSERSSGRPSTNPHQVTIGGKNAPYTLNTTYQRFDARENPSDRTKEPAAILEAAESGDSHACDQRVVIPLTSDL